MTFIKAVDKEVSDIGITEKFMILKNINVYQILAIKILKIWISFESVDNRKTKK